MADLRVPAEQRVTDAERAIEEIRLRTFQEEGSQAPTVDNPVITAKATSVGAKMTGSVTHTFTANIMTRVLNGTEFSFEETEVEIEVFHDANTDDVQVGSIIKVTRDVDYPEYYQMVVWTCPL